MNKFKVIALAFALLFLVGGTAYAATPPGFWDKVADKVATILAGKVETPAKITNTGQNLGAVTGPDLPNPFCQNNNCIYTAFQTQQLQTTTIFSVPDPFLIVTTTATDVVLQGNFTGATSTVDLARINVITGATTSYRIACGASASPTGVIPFANVIVSSTAATPQTSVATSTVGMIENNVTAIQGSILDVGTVSKITVGPATPYVVCTVDPNIAAGFTNANEAFRAQGIFRFSRTRF